MNVVSQPIRIGVSRHNRKTAMRTLIVQSIEVNYVLFRIIAICGSNTQIYDFSNMSPWKLHPKKTTTNWFGLDVNLCALVDNANY